MAEQGKALRLVLVGWANSGKSASGNTILGQDAFHSGRRSYKCVSRHAEVAGREVTIVDTPGWIHNTPVSTQTEIMSSTVPAPDATLLQIPLHMEITEGYIQSVTDYLCLLGDEVWSRTIVLFTYGSCLQNQTIECHIEGNHALQYLTRLCGNNYHVFENTKGADGNQIEELLIKIENLSLNNNLTEDLGRVKLFPEERETENTANKSSGLECEKPRSRGMQGFSELRVVLVGLQRSGKSSTGNTILQSAGFEEWTAKSQRAEAEVAGRRLVVIDTPPWQRDSGILSPDQNIVNWVCQCPPGPHALIFVLNLSSKFTLTDWSSVQKYIGLLGERAWEHVIVVFTGGDIIEGMDKKPFLRNKGASLRLLLEKCRNRHYFFNNRNRGNSPQVARLLEGIEKLSSQNNPGFYEIDKTIAAGMEEMNQALLERVQKRRQKYAAKEHAKHVIFHDVKAHKLTEVRIVLLGEKWSGKTAAAKIIANDHFKEEKTKCLAIETTIDNRIVQIVDTPGWSIHTWGQSTQQQETITEALSLCHPGPHAVLIVVNMRSSFTEKHRVSLEHNLACLSHTMWKHAMVLFTFGESLQSHCSLEDLETHIENEGENLKWLVEKCGNRCHIFRDTVFHDSHQVKELLEGIDKMVEANSGQYFTKTIYNEALSSERRSGSMDMEDDDFEYTQRERKMMEKMKKEMEQHLMVYISNYISTHAKAARSLPHTNPNMSLEMPASEDWCRDRQKGTDQQEEASSAYGSALTTLESGMWSIEPGHQTELPCFTPLNKL